MYLKFKLFGINLESASTGKELKALLLLLLGLDSGGPPEIMITGVRER